MEFLIERELREGEHPPGTASRHHEYWRRMVRAEVLVYARTWAEGRGDTLLLQVPDHTTLRRVLGDDPYVQERIVVTTRIRRLGDRVPERAWYRGSGKDLGQDREPAVAGTVTRELSAHERRLTAMMLDGLTNREMADRLRVSPRAVEQHITKIYRKLYISRRAQLAVALHGRPGA